MNRIGWSLDWVAIAGGPRAGGGVTEPMKADYDVRGAICGIEVRRSPEAVFMKGTKGKEFSIRQGNTTPSIDAKEADCYIKPYWAP